MASSRHPSLHDPGNVGDRVGLRASRCTRCGRPALPPETFGCRRCGASGSEQEPLALDGSATVRVSTVVHSDPLGSIPTPYTLARLALTAPDGETVIATGLLTGGPVDAGCPGHARLTGLGDDRLEVRFAAGADR